MNRQGAKVAKEGKRLKKELMQETTNETNQLEWKRWERWCSYIGLVGFIASWLLVVVGAATLGEMWLAPIGFLLALFFMIWPVVAAGVRVRRVKRYAKQHGISDFEVGNDFGFDVGDGGCGD